MVISRRTFLRTGLAGGVGLAAGAGVYGFAYERQTIAVTRTSLRVPGLPPPLDGLRIGVLTDLHRSRLVSESHVASARALLMAERPDLVALLGDYVTWGDRKFMGSCVEALDGLVAPHGVFAAIGNHDDENAVRRALGRLHYDVLIDARTELRVRGEALTLAGIRYWTKRAREIRPVVRGHAGTVILLAHDPRRVAEAAALDVPVILSGHTHGGQIVLPVVGPVAARKFPIAEGTTRLGGTQLFVSRGIGTVFVPVRLNCPPEVAVVTLSAA